MAEQYYFRVAKDGQRAHQDGSVWPFVEIEVDRATPEGGWETVGYCTVRMQKVLRDEGDVEDLSLVFSARVNPKNEPEGAKG